MNDKPYRAVRTDELIATLKTCSPDYLHEGYVIGPDINGRLCHVASCLSYSDALRYAEQLNEKKQECK